MHLKAALLHAAAAGALLLVSACGGGVDDGSLSKGASGTSSGGSSCQPLTQATVVGGSLFVAEQGPVGVTLLNDGGLSPAIFDDVNTFGRGFMILYDNVSGMVVGNAQDKFGFAKPFPPGTPVGTSTQMQLQPPSADVIRDYGPVPSTFPKGVPLELWLKKTDGNSPTLANSSGTAGIGKDTWPYSFPTASVAYGTNNTATVTFFANTDGPHFTVGLTNVFGTRCS
jgi:hypothetical protein